MGFSVYLLPEAEQDFNEAVAGYGGQQSSAAIRFYSEVADAISDLENHPTHYGYYIENYRRILLETFPYRIVFRMEELYKRLP